MRIELRYDIGQYIWTVVERVDISNDFYENARFRQ